jgi:acyl-CoA reductase-like NAD-dependent aldehyde dehydrogenase
VGIMRLYLDTKADFCPCSERVYDEFASAMVAEVKKMKLGNGMDDGV